MFLRVTLDSIRNSCNVFWQRSFLTEISTALVRDKTRTVSNDVIRFSWLGRVVEKKL